MPTIKAWIGSKENNNKSFLLKIRKKDVKIAIKVVFTISDLWIPKRFPKIIWFKSRLVLIFETNIIPNANIPEKTIPIDVSFFILVLSEINPDNNMHATPAIVAPIIKEIPKI